MRIRQSPLCFMWHGVSSLLFLQDAGFLPSCHAKRLEEWGEWVRETLLLDVPHRQVVFVIPKMLRIFFKYKRWLLDIRV